MAKGIDLSIAADTRAAMSAIQRGIIDPLEDVTDLLERTGREGQDAGNDLERGMREAQRRTADARDEIRDLRDELNRAGRAGRQVGDDAAAGMHRVKDGAAEVSQEMGSNLGEAVSSFRGDLADLGQVGQDTLGGLAATLAGAGPLGIVGAAGLAAAAIGVGGLNGEQEKLNEQVQNMKRYFADAWREAQQGGRDYIDVATQIAEQNDIMFNPDRADEYKRIQEDANRLGLDRSVLLRAAAGEQEALNVVIERTGDLIDEQNRKPRQNGLLGTAEWDEQKKHLDEVNNRWREYGRINDENKQKASDAAAATSERLLDLVRSADDAAVSVDELGNKMIELPTGETIYIDAETGQATLDLEKFKGDADGVVNHINGRRAVIRVRTEVDQRAYDAFVQRVRNTTIKIRGRVVTTPDGGGWNG